MKGAYVRLVTVFLFTVACRAQGVQQQPSPLRGQGVPSANVSEGIYISAFLDRLLQLDEQLYRFDAVLYMYVTWVDEGAIAQFFSNNIATNCADPSRADYSESWCSEFYDLCQRFNNATAGSAVWRQIRGEGDYFLGADIGIACKTYNSDGTPARTSCNRYCSNGYNNGDCCDGIFIPDINVANIYTLSQDFVISSQLLPQYDYRKENYGAWMWSVSFHATFFNRMNFRGFPWDSQELLIQLKYTHDPQDSNTTSVLLPSSAGVLSLRPRRNGDDSSGWRVNSVYMQPYAISETRVVQGNLSPPAVNDPVPLFMTTTEANGDRRVSGLTNVFESRLNPGNQLLVIIDVSRYSSYYVVNSLIPIILSTCLGFFIFLLEASELEKRLVLLVTLFLALTALQFVISSNLPASSYVLKTQALVLTGYAFFMAMAIESWLVYWLGTSHQRHLRSRAWREAYKKYLRGELSANELANAGSGKRIQRDSIDVAAVPADGDVEELEAPSLSRSSGPGQAQADGAGDPKPTAPPLSRMDGRRWFFHVPVKPLKHDSDYAGWLSERVDRWSLILLVITYIVVLAVILAT